MATSRAQRAGIWIIAVALTVGTVFGFLATILSSKNQQSTQAALTKFNKEYTEYQAKAAAQAKDLSAKYYPQFSTYKSSPASFDAASVKTLGSNDLVVGDGEKVTDTTKFATYYIGWTPDGKVFDQSIDGESLKAPIAVDGLKNASLIEGWKKGLIGMNIGGIRELTIPSDQAYGASGQGDSIKPNTPLKFIIMAIPKPEEIKQPQPTQEVINAYGQNQ